MNSKLVFGRLSAREQVFCFQQSLVYSSGQQPVD